MLKAGCVFSVFISPRGSVSDRTVAIEWQVTVLAMLYIGRSVTCGIHYSFTPKPINFLFLMKKKRNQIENPVLYIVVYYSCGQY